MALIAATPSLIEVCSTGGYPNLVLALETMRIYDLLPLLCARPSFMASPALSEAELADFADHIRDPAGGNWPEMPAGDAGQWLLRLVIYTARARFQANALASNTPAPNAPAPAPAATPAADDPLKVLPAKELDAVWERGARATGGFTRARPMYRLSDAIMTRMIRANKLGELWIPTLDGAFAYRETSANRVVTTLIKAAPDQDVSDLQLQLVQHQSSTERHDPVVLVADFCALLRDRSAALVACYATPEAGDAFRAAPRFADMSLHSLNKSASAVLLLPETIAFLERALLDAARRGCSKTELLTIDRQVIEAIIERTSRVQIDGNLAVEYVCDSRDNLFFPPSASSRQPVHDPTPDKAAPPSTDPTQRQLEALKRQASKLMSERDKAINDSKRHRPSTALPSSAARDPPPGRTVYGGTSGITGGGKSSSEHHCRSFNQTAGCWRETCNYRHACTVKLDDGKICNRSHSAINHPK